MPNCREKRFSVPVGVVKDRETRLECGRGEHADGTITPQDDEQVKVLEMWSQPFPDRVQSCLQQDHLDHPPVLKTMPFNVLRDHVGGARGTAFSSNWG